MIATSDKRGLNVLVGFVSLWVLWRLYRSGALAILAGYLPFVGLETAYQGYSLATGNPASYGTTAGALLDLVLILAEGIGAAVLLVGSRIWASVYDLAVLARGWIDAKRGPQPEEVPVVDPLVAVLQQIKSAIDDLDERLKEIEAKQ